MKKSLLILSAILFLFGCKKENDPRDKYVGHYAGTGYVYGNAINNTQVYLSKHPNIDNALMLQCSTSNMDTQDQDEYSGNRIYLSNKEFMYQKDMFYWDLYVDNRCRYVDPDSLYCTAYFAVYDYNNGQVLYYNDVYLKVKRVD